MRKVKIVSGVGEHRYGIGYDNFFCQSDGKDEDAVEQVFGSRIPIRLVLKLRQHFFGQDNRSGYELREERHEVTVV